MATLLISPATLINPAEYTNTKPIHCAECGREWDEDQLDTHIFELDDKAYCWGRCYDSAAAAEHRRQATEILKDALTEARRDIERLGCDPDFRRVEDDAEDAPATIIEAILDRLPRVADGLDSGFRSEVMLTRSEAIELSLSLENVLNRLSYSLRYDLGTTEYKPFREAHPIVTQTAGEQLAKLGTIALSLAEFQQRSQVVAA